MAGDAQLITCHVGSSETVSYTNIHMDISLEYEYSY